MASLEELLQSVGCQEYHDHARAEGHVLGKVDKETPCIVGEAVKDYQADEHDDEGDDSSRTIDVEAPKVQELVDAMEAEAIHDFRVLICAWVNNR